MAILLKASKFRDNVRAFKASKMMRVAEGVKNEVKRNDYTKHGTRHYIWSYMEQLSYMEQSWS
jgi:hypothetical protein